MTRQGVEINAELEATRSSRSEDEQRQWLGGVKKIEAMIGDGNWRKCRACTYMEAMKRAFTEAASARIPIIVTVKS